MNPRIFQTIIRVICIASVCLGAMAAFGQCPKESDPFSSVSYKASARGAGVKIDQCANGRNAEGAVQCTGSAWQSSNICKDQAHYMEGDSVPYRLKFAGLVVGNTYTATIEWDTTESSAAKHAIDYLTSFDETERTADPCSDVVGCDLGNMTSYPIPLDPNVAMGSDGILGTEDDVSQKPGFFTLFGGDITEVSNYTMSGTYSGASKTSVQITFVPNLANPVLAWSGHLSTRMDWGMHNSAIAIEGSPYHMRFVNLNGMAGNLDLSLSSHTAIFPGAVIIRKLAFPVTSQMFSFTADGPRVWDFSLYDDGSGEGNSQSFEGLTEFGSANAITITEDSDTGQYQLAGIACIEDPHGGSGQNNSTIDLSSGSANIILEEGETVTCTFISTFVVPATASIGGRVYDAEGRAIPATMTLTNTSSGEVTNTTTNMFGYYQFDNLETETTYIVKVTAKGHTFTKATKTIVLMDNVMNVDFIGTRQWSSARPDGSR